MARSDKISLLLHGQIAQLVEQRTENPCVAGSIPVLATSFKIYHHRDAETQREERGSACFKPFRKKEYFLFFSLFSLLCVSASLW